MYYGQLEQYWVGHYKFCEKIGVEYDPTKSSHLHLWQMIADSMGWWSPYEGAVLCCERPVVCKVTADGKLHCDDGPAMEFADGWKVYAIAGKYVPQKTVDEHGGIEPYFLDLAITGAK